MIKDDGSRHEFNTGAVRDIQEGKGRCDLLPPLALLRLARHFEDKLQEGLIMKLLIKKIDGKKYRVFQKRSD